MEFGKRTGNIHSSADEHITSTAAVNDIQEHRARSNNNGGNDGLWRIDFNGRIAALTCSNEEDAHREQEEQCRRRIHPSWFDAGDPWGHHVTLFGLFTGHWL